MSLDDTGVSQQMAIIFGPSLHHQLSEHIFKILQDLTVAVVSHRQTDRQTDTQTDYYNPPPTRRLIMKLSTTFSFTTEEHKTIVSV